MGGFWRGTFGLGAPAEGTPSPAEERAAALRDDVVDQLVTLAWAALLAGQEWARRGPAGGPWTVCAMAAVAAGYAGWRLGRLVPLYRAARAGTLPAEG